MLKKTVNKKSADKKILMGDAMISELGIANIPSAKQKKIVEALEKNIQRKIVIAVLQNLNDKQLEAFDAVLELNDPKIIENFISSSIPGGTDFIKKIAVEVVEEFKKLACV